MKVSIIGVGDVGIDIAHHTHNGGHNITAFDLSAERCQLAREQGVEVASEILAAVADAEVHLVVVATDAQSETVTREILKYGQKESVIVILATNSPGMMYQLGLEAAAAGFGFVDAPVCFDRQGAREGTLASLCGGNAEDIAKITPVLDTYSRKVHSVGPIGAGQIAKACNNMLHWSACIANFEVLSLAKRYGLDAQRMRETLLECPGKNGTLKDWERHPLYLARERPGCSA